MSDHENFMKDLRSRLVKLIHEEPLLDELAKLTSNESRLDLSLLKDLLGLEHGESMKLFIKRGDGQIIDVIVPLDGRVKDLKKAVRVHFQRKQKAAGINWKYVWKTYCLEYNNEKLLDDKKSLRDDHSISNKSELAFARIGH